MPSTPPPQRPPNFLLIAADALGYSDLGPYGSEIPTPACDALAADGYVMTGMHRALPAASSAASLLTGMTDAALRRPAADGRSPRQDLRPDVPTLAWSLRAAGYATFAVGLWPLTPADQRHEGAGRATWPLQVGFDRFVGLFDAHVSRTHPHDRVVDNGRAPSSVAEGTQLGRNLVDQALDMVRALRVHSSRRFFLHLVLPVTSPPLDAPLLAPHPASGPYRDGWQVVAARRRERQALQGTAVAGPPASLPEWDGLSAARRDALVAAQERYAAAVAQFDADVGVLVEGIAQLGAAEETVVVLTALAPAPPPLPHPDGQGLLVDHPEGWRRTAATPHAGDGTSARTGGLRVPLLLTWTGGLRRASDDGGVRPQPQQHADVVPTLLELAGLQRVARNDGGRTPTADGRSFVDVLLDPTAGSTHPSQFVADRTERALTRDGWKVVGTGPPERIDWQLFDLAQDPAETQDVADANPARLAALVRAWSQTARLLPVRPSTAQPASAQVGGDDPDTDSDQPADRPLRLGAGAASVEGNHAAALVRDRGFALDVLLPLEGCGDGILVSHGDAYGGYVLHVEDGTLHLAWLGGGVLHRVQAGAVAEVS